MAARRGTLIGAKTFMDNIKIRYATTLETDLNAVVKYIYQTEEFPGGSLKECALWTKKRIESGFYIQVAETDREIIGFAVWNISDEPDRKFIYLSMLQIDANYQRKGIGQRMIAYGIENAKKNNCIEVVTSPDVETGADIFYRKLGFKDGRKQYLGNIKTEKYKDYKFEKTILDKVPFSAVKERKFIFGKCGEFSSRYIWGKFNQNLSKPSENTEKQTVVLLADGTYIQIIHWDDDDNGVLIIWANTVSYEDIIKSALSFGYSIGLSQFEINYLEDEEKFVDGFDIYGKRESDSFEQIYKIYST